MMRTMIPPTLSLASEPYGYWRGDGDVFVAESLSLSDGGGDGGTGSDGIDDRRYRRRQTCGMAASEISLLPRCESC